MLTMRIDQADLCRPWAWTGTRYATGGSWIAPFGHPAIEHQVLADDEGATVVVRERRAAGHDGTGDEVRIRLCPGEVAVRAGTGCVAPLYLASSSGVLHGSWDLGDLRQVARADRLNEVEVARLLTLWLRYGANTFLPGVKRLTERAVITWDRRELAVAYPSPALHTTAREIRPGVDVVAAYEQLLDTVISRHVYAPGSSVVELSGGIDSAQVALSLATRHPGQVMTTAMRMPGKVGDQQQRRRYRMHQSARFRLDVATDAIAPFTTGDVRLDGLVVSPYEEIYAEAKTAMLEAAVGHGARTVWTGVGGDEMVALTASEVTRPAVGHDRELRPWISDRTAKALDGADDDIAPPSVINEMTLLAFGYAAPQILRAGCWPVHPLADPDMIRFGEWLPAEWRRNKHLPRERMHRTGLPDWVVHPEIPENFSDVMKAGVTRNALPMLRSLLTSSALIDHGFIDPAGLAGALDRIEAGGYEERDAELYDVLALELAVRAFS